MNELVCDCNVPGFDPAKGWTLYVCVCVALLVGVSGLRTNHRRRRGCVLFYYKIVLLNSFIRSVPHNVIFLLVYFDKNLISGRRCDNWIKDLVGVRSNKVEIESMCKNNNSFICYLQY